MNTAPVLKNVREHAQLFEGICALNAPHGSVARARAFGLVGTGYQRAGEPTMEHPQ